MKPQLIFIIICQKQTFSRLINSFKMSFVLGIVPKFVISSSTEEEKKEKKEDPFTVLFSLYDEISACNALEKEDGEDEILIQLMTKYGKDDKEFWVLKVIKKALKIYRGNDDETTPVLYSQYEATYGEFSSILEKLGREDKEEEPADNDIEDIITQIYIMSDMTFSTIGKKSLQTCGFIMLCSDLIKLLLTKKMKEHQLDMISNILI